MIRVIMAGNNCKYNKNIWSGEMLRILMLKKLLVNTTIYWRVTIDIQVPVLSSAVQLNIRLSK